MSVNVLKWLVLNAQHFIWEETTLAGGKDVSGKREGSKGRGCGQQHPWVSWGASMATSHEMTWNIPQRLTLPWQGQLRDSAVTAVHRSQQPVVLAGSSSYQSRGRRAFNKEAQGTVCRSQEMLGRFWSHLNHFKTPAG